jgi:predicted Rossmann fold flavoprotein
MAKHWDAIVVGAGAAGLFCAGVAGQRGRRVLLLDHAPVLGEKIRISGGGRCNFTNRETGPQHFLSMNPHFAKSALSRYTPRDFIALLNQEKIGFHEKHRGQLFCNDSSGQIIDLLLQHCHKGGVTIRHPVSVEKIHTTGQQWQVFTSQGVETAASLVIATGGLPVPAIGATDFALRFAKEFNLPVVPTQPGLVPLSFTDDFASTLAELSGLSLPVTIRSGQPKQRYGACEFEEDLLITHKGLSGPAVLQASSYWAQGEPITVSWISEQQCAALFADDSHRARLTETMLGQVFPQRLAKAFAHRAGLLGRKWAEVGKKDRTQLAAMLSDWEVKPAGTLGWKKAEVMVGGIDTQALDSQTMAVKSQPGLYFIGECVDVTGHLGGHNFQWAWASGFACAQSI